MAQSRKILLINLDGSTRDADEIKQEIINSHKEYEHIENNVMDRHSKPIEFMYQIDQLFIEESKKKTLSTIQIEYYENHDGTADKNIAYIKDYCSLLSDLHPGVAIHLKAVRITPSEPGESLNLSKQPAEEAIFKVNVPAVAKTDVPAAPSAVHQKSGAEQLLMKLINLNNDKQMPIEEKKEQALKAVTKYLARDYIPLSELSQLAALLNNKHSKDYPYKFLREERFFMGNFQTHGNTATWQKVITQIQEKIEQQSGKLNDKVNSTEYKKLDDIMKEHAGRGFGLFTHHHLQKLTKDQENLARKATQRTLDVPKITKKR